MSIILSKKWWVNVLLAGLAVFLGFKAYGAWSLRAVVPPDETVAATLPAGPQISVVQRTPVAAGNYDLVVAKNLFVAEREEIIPAPPEPEPKKAPEKKPEEKPTLTRAEQRAVARLGLMGVVLTDDRKTALIRDGGRGRGRGGQWVVEGDEIEGMRVSEISDEMVLLKSGDLEVEILLYDPEKSRRRTAPRAPAKAARPTVVSSPPPAAAGGEKAVLERPTTARRGTTRRPRRRIVRRKATP